MAYEPALDRASIVMLGQFNPAIVQPAWMARYALIRDEEAANTKNLVVTDEITSFEIDWFTVQVTKERFTVYTDQPAYSLAIRDLTLGTFGLLEHTPIRALGINRHLHYSVESTELWHQYGHYLAPKEPWTGLIKDPGMRALTIWGAHPDADDSRIQFVVEPSVRIRPGIYFSLNEHYPKPDSNAEVAASVAERVGETADPQRRRRLLEALGKRWESAQKYAREVAETILDRGRDASRR